MKKIYFLCTGNSCRSQMAEGYARQLLDLDQVDIRSAGIVAHGLNPRAVKVMADDGIDISQQESKIIDPTFFAAADLIVTLCGDARDKCPVISPGTAHQHWDLPDPALATGSDKEILAEFVAVRDEIKRRVMTLK